MKGCGMICCRALDRGQGWGKEGAGWFLLAAPQNVGQSHKPTLGERSWGEGWLGVGIFDTAQGNRDKPPSFPCQWHLGTVLPLQAGPFHPLKAEHPSQPPTCSSKSLTPYPESCDPIAILGQPSLKKPSLTPKQSESHLPYPETLERLLKTLNTENHPKQQPGQEKKLVPDGDSNKAAARFAALSHGFVWS